MSPPGRARAFKGKLIKRKPLAERQRLAERIREIDVDVLCVQEVEDIDALREFNNANIKDGGMRGHYPWLALIEGNDPRFIDVAVMSKRPLGGDQLVAAHTPPSRSDRSRVLARPAGDRRASG